MKIETPNSLLVNKTDASKNSKAAGKGTLAIAGQPEEVQASAGDTVKISDRSRLIMRATELASLAPDVRSEKVADLTARIAAGTYNVSSRDVADSIIKKNITGIL
jgi:flagellar biosynthesis anti-sigma factor FlgM